MLLGQCIFKRVCHPKIYRGGYLYLLEWICVPCTRFHMKADRLSLNGDGHDHVRKIIFGGGSPSLHSTCDAGVSQSACITLERTISSRVRDHVSKSEPFEYYGLYITYEHFF